MTDWMAGLIVKSPTGCKWIGRDRTSLYILLLLNMSRETRNFSPFQYTFFIALHKKWIAQLGVLEISCIQVIKEMQKRETA